MIRNQFRKSYTANMLEVEQWLAQQLEGGGSTLVWWPAPSHWFPLPLCARACVYPWLFIILIFENNISLHPVVSPYLNHHLHLCLLCQKAAYTSQRRQLHH